MPLVNKTVDTSMGNIKLPERQIEFGKKQLAKQYEQSAGIKRPVSARLGNFLTGELFLPDTDNARVYISSQGDEPAGLGSMPKIGIPKELLVFGQPVLIQRMPSGEYRYTSVDAGTAAIFNEGDTDAPDQTPITQSQLSWGTLQPDTGLIATVKGAIYGDNAVKDLSTANFASSPLDTSAVAINIPTMANRAIGVLVQLDPATATLSYKQSAQFNSALNLAEAYYQGLLPLRDSGKWRIGYLRLANGITQFDYASVWTCPEWFPDALTGEVGGLNFVTQGSDPTTPAANLWRVYFKADGFYFIDEVGDVHAIRQLTQELYIPIAQIFPSITNGCAAVAKTETATNKQNLLSLDFDQTTQEYAEFTVWMPSNWLTAYSVFVAPVWTAAAGTPGQTVVWNVQGRAYADDDAIDQAWGSAQASEDELLATGDIHYAPQTGGITLAGSPSAGQLVQFRISRDVASDNLAADAKLLGLKLYYSA